MNFENPFFIILIPIGTIFIIGGFLMSKYPPKSINHLYGYRTSTSMKNQDIWDYAQKFSSKKMIKYGLAQTLLSLVGFFNLLPVSLLNMFLGIGLIVILSALMIFETESALKKKLRQIETKNNS
ncbi:MAG: SdpI family protein [Algibacter sp.]